MNYITKAGQESTRKYLYILPRGFSPYGDASSNICSVIKIPINLFPPNEFCDKQLIHACDYYSSNTEYYYLNFKAEDVQEMCDYVSGYSREKKYDVLMIKNIFDDMGIEDYDPKVFLKARKQEVLDREKKKMDDVKKKKDEFEKVLATVTGKFVKTSGLLSAPSFSFMTEIKNGARFIETESDYEINNVYTDCIYKKKKFTTHGKDLTIEFVINDVYNDVIHKLNEQSNITGVPLSSLVVNISNFSEIIRGDSVPLLK